MKCIKWSWSITLAIIMVSALIVACSPATSPSPNPSSSPATSPSPNPSSSPATSPIKLGVLLSFTGPTAAAGMDHRRGIETFWEEKGYQVAGRKVELHFEDTQAKTDVGLNMAKKLVSEDGVAALYGFIWTNVAYAVQPYASEQRIPEIISAYATADALTKQQANPYTFRISYSGTVMGSTIGDWTYNQGYHKIALFGADYSAGYECIGATARRFVQLGGKIAQELYAPLNTTDFSPYIAQIDRTVDAVVGFIPAAMGVKFLQQYAEAGLQGKIPVIDNQGSQEENLDNMGDFAVGNVSMEPWNPTQTDAASKKFVSMWLTKYNDRPTYLAEAGYLSSEIIYEALASIQGNIENKDAFLQALREIDLTNTTRGDVKFDKYQSTIQDSIIEQVVKQPLWNNHVYANKVVGTYKSIDQFWPWKADEFFSWPQYSDLKGTWVERSLTGTWQ